MNVSHLALLVLTSSSLLMARNQKPSDVPGREGRGAVTLELPLSSRAPASARQHCLAWEPEGRPKFLLLCLHGIQTYAEWYGPLGREMARHHAALYALDRRGSGSWAFDQTHPQHAWHVTQQGDVADWREWIADIQAATKAMKARHPGVPLLLLGTSWGAKTALGALVEASPGTYDGAVFIAPAFATNVDPNLGARVGAGVIRTFSPGKHVDLTRKLPPSIYTDDTCIQGAWALGQPSSRENPLLQSVTLRFARQSELQLGAAERALEKSSCPPVLAVFGSQDGLVNTYAAASVLNRLREDGPTHDTRFPRLTSLILAGMHHASIVEKPKELADTILTWNQRREHPSIQPRSELWFPAYATGYALRKDGSCNTKASQMRNALRGWPAGLQVAKGDTVNITWDDRYLTLDRSGLARGPEGCVGEVNFIKQIFKGSLLVKKDEQGRRLPYFTLLGVIHPSTGKPDIIPLPIAPGKSCSITPRISGSLSFILNDAIFWPHLTYTNNQGTLKLTVQGAH